MIVHDIIYDNKIYGMRVITVESLAYQLALQNEILGENHVELPDHSNSRMPLSSSSRTNLLEYQSPKKMLSPLTPYSVSPISKTT